MAAQPSLAFMPPRPSGPGDGPQPAASGVGAAQVWQHAEGEIVDGKYRLLRPLGRGGMAEVWLAVHLSLRTEIAIKFLAAGVTGDAERSRSVLERFVFEAQISARLGARTRHVVSVHDAGVHAGVPYLVMEYVAGRTLLAEIRDNGAIPPARFADMLDQIADALAVAHEMGIVHRDLKPSNLMLVDGPAGAVTVKVADFGIAKALRNDPMMKLDRPKETEAGVMLGSPSYMSPEQIQSPLSTTPQTDIWSLAVLSYEALLDWPPFHGTTAAELMISISTRDFELPSRIRPSLPRGLDGWFTRALAKEPKDRFATVAEMTRAFRAAITPAPAPARPQRAVAAAVAASLVTLCLLGAGAWRAWRALPPPSVAPARRLSPLLRPAVPWLAPPAPRQPASPAPPVHPEEGDQEE